MSETTMIPVITDDTGKGIMNAILSGNAGQRENRDLVAEQNELLKKIEANMGGGTAKVHYVPLTCTANTANGATTYSYAMNEDTFLAAVDAYLTGKCVMLQMDYSDKTTMAPLISYVYKKVSSKVVQQLVFYAHSNPENTQGRFSIALHKSADGSTKVLCDFGRVGIGSDTVTCNVTIGGTEYTKLDAALAALAAR